MGKQTTFKPATERDFGKVSSLNEYNDFQLEYIRNKKWGWPEAVRAVFMLSALPVPFCATSYEYAWYAAGWLVFWPFIWPIISLFTGISFFDKFLD